MIDLERAYIKAMKFVKWLEKETRDSINLEIGYWSDIKKESVRIYSCFYNEQIRFTTLEDFLKTIDIFEGNIELFFKDKESGLGQDFEYFRNLTKQPDYYLKRALECYQISFEEYKIHPSSELIDNLAEDLKRFEY